MDKGKKIDKFRFVLLDDSSHLDLFSIRFTRISFIVSAVSGGILLLLIIFCLIAFTPIRSIIPGYPNAHSKKAAIQNAIKVDSLENVIFRWEMYTENLKRVLEGDQSIKIDSTINTISRTSVEDLNEAYLAKQDSIMRQKIKEEELFEVSAGSTRNLAIEGVLFFSPVKGVVIRNFDSNIHPFVDVSTPPGTIVKAALDGTVIYTGWDKDNGSTIYIQHDGDLVSAYKHNESLLKETGDKIKAGAPIAVIGKPGDSSEDTYLHFELWHDGESIDPTKYINF